MRLVPADKTHRNYTGHFVYPDDAQDLKCHPFFHGIPWNNMQEYVPPFTPRVKNWEDTKYFEEEGTISDLDSDSSDEDAHALKVEEVQLDQDGHQQEAQGIIPETPKLELDGQALLTNYKPKRAKEKKRPRDKILRDENCGKLALQLRKNSAFIGYGYQRAQRVSEIIEEALANEASNQSIDLGEQKKM